jgi:hypothetical protein
VESRPISRNKKWVVEEILRHDIAAGDEIREQESAAEGLELEA